MAREVGCERRVSLAAAIAVAVPAAATIYMAQPDNFSLYQPIGTAALWLTARGSKGHRRSFALAGLMVGLATPCPETTACCSVPPSASHSSGIAGGPGGRRAARAGRFRGATPSPASACSCS